MSLNKVVKAKPEVPTTLDIVKLIEKNPITRLSKDYQNSLINKIKVKFTESQQQLFVASFYCYLNHNNKNDFIIDLDEVWKWLGFSRKDPAKRLLEKFFIKDLNYKILLHQSVEQDKNDHGGHNKEQILLTINTFKKLCLKADTKKADEIHEYYMGLEELLQETLNEETQELRDQLILKDKIIEDNINKNKNLIKINNHELFIEKFNNRRCVYLIEIEANKFIKIGSTKDIKTRIIEYKRTYKNASLKFLDIFECDYFREIEKNILEDNIIRQNLQREPVYGHKSNEIVKLSDIFNYNQLILIIKTYLSKNISLFTPEQILEKQRIELENNKIQFNLLNTIINNDKYSNVIENIIKDQLPGILSKMNLDNNPIINKQINNQDQDQNKNHNANNGIDKEPNIIFTENVKNEIAIQNTKNSKNSISRQIKQVGKTLLKIDPNNLQNIIKTYDTITYALRDDENKGYQSTGIRKAIKFNRIYKDYRWLFVGKNENVNDVISQIQPTKISKKKHPIYDTILELNDDKTKIIQSYSSKNELAKELNISSHLASSIINTNTKYDNKYFIEYYKCPQNLLDNYSGVIKKRIVTNTKLIKQTNIINNEINIFNSMSEITRLLGYNCKTINKAIKNNTVLYGYRWEYYTNNNDKVIKV